MAHFTSITIGVSVEAEFKKVLTVEQFEQCNDLLDNLVSFSMFTHNWKDAPAKDAAHHDDYQEALSIIDQPARDSLWWLIDTLGVAKAKEIAEAMDRATGRYFGAEMFKEVWFSYDNGREPDAA